MSDNNAHQYRDSGLHRVFLLNGFETESKGIRSTTRYADIDKLHQQITAALVNQPQPLDHNELYFLREGLGLTEQDLAYLLECGGQDIRYWETGVKSPGLMREMALRVIASNANDTPLTQSGITALRLDTAESRSEREPLMFRHSEDGSWSRCEGATTPARPVH